MRLQERLARTLRDAGHLTADWYEALATVDRGAFVPGRVWLRESDGYRLCDRAVHPDRWQRAVYGDTPVVTQVADPECSLARHPTSSASMPRMVARMLAALDVHEGNRVLEAGTGTGYNAALLCHRLGDARVSTIETDPALADQARASLKAAGHNPTVRIGDAARGDPDGAPYDRVIATYAVHHIPEAWIQQTRPGGIIVTPWGTGLYNGVLARLTSGGHTATGPVIDDSSFMWDRGQEPDRDLMRIIDRIGGRPPETPTGLNPRDVLDDPNALFNAGAHHPGIRCTVGFPDPPDDSGEFTLWLTDGRSWAAVDHEPGAARHLASQYGPRRLWDDLVGAHQWWLDHDAPARTRYGLTAGPDGQHVWLDDPAQIVG